MGNLRQVSSTLVMVAVSVALATPCICDTVQSERIESRISALEALTASLQNTVIRLRQESNKIKKLTVASLNIALTPEEDQCKQTKNLVDIIGGLSFYVGLGPNSCELMGTALYPAMSCSQLHEACHKPSGSYFTRGTVFSEVYCEMDVFDGGWARFGRGGMESVWNYVDEHEQEISLDIISPPEVKLIQDLHFNTFRVFTDVAFVLQADDSTNPSTLVMRSLPWLEEETISIGHGYDHTRLELTDEGDRLICFSNNSRCGENGLPRSDGTSRRLVFTTVYFGPRAIDRGAFLDFDENWSRNKYTWSGSYYYILAK